MVDRVSATIEFQDKRVTFEGPEEFVRSEVNRLAGLSSVGVLHEGAPSELSSGSLNERTLVSEKKPSGHSETVAVLAYALQRGGQEEFSPDDIQKAYLRAGVRPPKFVDQA